MIALPDRILKSFEKELVNYKALKEIVGKKNISLKEKNIEEIEKTTILEEKIINKINESDKEKRTILKEYADRLKIPLEEVTIQKIIIYLSEEYRVRIIKIREELKSIIMEIKKINQENVVLIQSSLEVVDFVLRTAATDDEKTDIYEPGKKHNAANIKPILVNKTI